jgi:prepilin-type N-terminal cleavage/methylation domain-containing protein
MSMRARSGFSLLEAVVALAIVGVTAVAALASIGAELRAAEDARTALEAEALAVHRMSTLEMLTSAQLQRIPDSLARGIFEPPFERYRWIASSEPVMGEEGLTEVRLDVVWDQGSFPLRTLLFRPSPFAAVGVTGAPGGRNE